MTPRQLSDIYQHPRDKDGKIIVPQPATAELSFEELLLRLRAAAQALHLPPDQLKQAEAALKAKYGRDT